MLIKTAKLKDAKFILYVVNISRKNGNFTNSKLLDYKHHIAWFKKKLKLNRDIIYVAYHNKKKIGYIRFDFIANRIYEVSIALLPKYFGKNFATQIFICSFTKFKKKFKPKKVFAKVKKNNKASQKFFMKNSFENIHYSKKIFKKLINYNKYVFYKFNIN
jgi:RimJ/RimL family protein N-acetyltransferase